MKAKDLLTSITTALSINATLFEVISTFSSHTQLNVVPLISTEYKPVGLITPGQLAKAIQRGCPHETPISKLSYTPVTSFHEDTPIDALNHQSFDYIALHDDGGQFTGLLNQSDIALSILRNKNQELLVMEAFFESSYDGIYITQIVDGRPKTLRINASYERITGLNRSLMLNRYMDDLVKDNFISESGSLAALKKGKPVTLIQTFKSGLKGLITSTPVADENGKVSMVATNVRDITELSDLKNKLDQNKKLAEKYYSEIEAMKDQFLQTPGLKAKDPKMLEILHLARKVSKIDSTILLLGESGVGKEEIAKYIHKNSLRNDKPFIKINCSAIPDNLIESELFGYEKGAFTGANNNGKKGLFEVANTGTIFLDEIGELSLDIQVKLLRVLQEQEITKVGGLSPIKIDVRVISATNKDLKNMVKEKKFREDLFYRLNVVPVSIPPLRDRKEDIFPLVSHFIKRINEKYKWNKSFSRDALDAFYAYSWPGNVRELGNIVERAAVMSSDQLITCDNLPSIIASLNTIMPLRFDSEIMPLDSALGIVEKDLIDKAYDKFGNVRDAAKALNIAPSTFVRKRKKYID